MITNVLFPAELQLRVDRIEMEKNAVNISVTSTNGRSVCPHCQTISERVHSSYNRHPADLPLAGYTIGLDMSVHRFFCDNGCCEAKTFTERIPAFIQHYARRTNRLATRQQSVAIEAGGAIAQRVLTILDMPLNSDTLIRFVRNAPEPDVATPRVVGVDEWSKSKGQSYGTILVDLEAHRPVDLLPDKSAESFAAWLREHPGVEVISRDRGVEYIKGANEGAPDAIQVADRWHLLKNLRDALKRMLETRRACLKAAADKPDQDLAEQQDVMEQRLERSYKEPKRAIEEPTGTTQKLTKAEKRDLEGRTRRQERYETVKELYQRGLSKSEIGRRLGLDFRTVAKYIKADECPIHAERRKRSSKLNPYMDYMTKRWDEGCHNATRIWREIQKLGFDGARRTVGDWATKKRKATSSSDPISEKIVPWSSSRASWLLVKQEADLTDEDRQALDRMKQTDGKVAEAYALGQRFVDMVRERQSSALTSWLEDATRSRIEALKQFASGIKQDLAAVTNALSLPWSNGQTEGQVNRLKLIKRQMYGRANFDLLRRRVLARPLRC